MLMECAILNSFCTLIYSWREDTAVQFDCEKCNKGHQRGTRRAAPHVRARPRAPDRELQPRAAQAARAGGQFLTNL